MSYFYERKAHRYPLYAFIVLSAVFAAFLLYFQWVLGIVSFLLLGFVLYYVIKSQRSLYAELEQYISNLSYRIKKVGEEALMGMPIGIMLINDEYEVEWANQFLASCFGEQTLVGRSLYDLADSLIPLIKQEQTNEEIINIRERYFKVIIRREERLLYFFDVTEQVELQKQYEAERLVLAVIFLDNYDEITRNG